MKITDDVNWNIQVADIETLKCYSLFSFYNPDTKEWNEFEISEYRNDLLKFVSFYRKGRFDYGVWYNGIGFDCPVIEKVLRSAELWLDIPGEQLAGIIYQYAQDVIDNKKHNVFAEFREEHFHIPCIDVFEINGLSNEARWSSLKKIEFNLDYPSVEELPIPHTVEKLTIGECEQIRSYCRNDIMATLMLFELTLGNTPHPIYKGNNQIELRLNIQEEFKLDCLNYSDIKIGDELMKHAYMEAKGMTLKELPRKGMFRKHVDLKKCVPSFVEFKTPLLQNLLKKLKKTQLKRKEKWEEKFTIGTTAYVQGAGGIHSVNSGEVYKASNSLKIKTIDVSSMYPASIVNNSYYPKHLGKELLIVYKQRYDKRLELKPLAKNDKKIKGVVDALKLQMNVVFGKMGALDSWLYDPECLLSVTLTGQFSLLMLIEELELLGFKVIIANTDGLEVIVSVEREEEFHEVCKKWEQKTGYILEEDEYERMYMSSVNDYIAVTVSGKPKYKGDGISDFDLWKNKSNRVVALALQAYFVEGKNPDEFIRNHGNIYDFCIMAKATKQLHIEEQWEENGEVQKTVHKKLVRYYLCNNCKSQFYKRGMGSTGKTANISLNAPTELGEIYVKYFNQYVDLQMKEYGIDYDQYILKAYRIIDKIEGTKRIKTLVDSRAPQTQLSLF